MNEEILPDQKSETDTDSDFDFPAQNKKQKIENCYNEYCKAGITTLNQIKEKYRESKSKSERILLLTLAPKDYGRIKFMKEFNSTE